MPLPAKTTLLISAATLVPDSWIHALTRISFDLAPDRVTQLLWAVVASASSALIVLLVARWFRHRRSRNAVVTELANRGLSVAQIARRLELSQDTIRQLLGPDECASRKARGGNSFRRKRRRTAIA